MQTIGFEVSLWVFWDQWRLFCHPNCYGRMTLAIGPFRAQWSAMRRVKNVPISFGLDD